MSPDNNNIPTDWQYIDKFRLSGGIIPGELNVIYASGIGRSDFPKSCITFNILKHRLEQSPGSTVLIWDLESNILEDELIKSNLPNIIKK